jgi:exonuclease III
VKVATFNINNINKRLDNLLSRLKKERPDVVSLQEVKAEQRAFPIEAIRSLGMKLCGKVSARGTGWLKSPLRSLTARLWPECWPVIVCFRKTSRFHC